MKKSVLIILFLAASTFLEAQVFTSANKELAGVAEVKDASGWIRFHENVAVDPAGFFTTYGKAFKLGANDRMVITRTQTDKPGYVHTRYQQLYKSIPVMGAEYFIHSLNGKARAGNGKLITGLTMNTNPKLTPAQAIQAATNFVGARKYMWENAANETLLKHMTGKADATYSPRAELVIVDRKFTATASNYRLAWKINVYAENPLSKQDIYVDAQTGGIIHVVNRLCTNNVLGTAHTKYSGVQPINTDSTGPGQYRLRESATGGGIETYNMKKSTDYGTAVDFTDADNDWNNINTQKDEVATDAHWGAEMTYDYYLAVHGRQSYNDSSAKLVSFVHYDVNYSNAFWDGTRMTYGDGDGVQNGPLTSLDVCGHEISHGVTEYTAGLVYQDEPGALNESFSDMMGTAVEFYALNGGGDWLIGADFDLQTGKGFRDMSNPKANQNPNTYKGQYWYTGPADNGGVHNNSGVGNYWFYLLSHGGSGTNDNNRPYAVNGLGIDTAAKIAYRAWSLYMGMNSQYIDTREATLQAAEDLYGPCSAAFIQCANAWHAVGIGTAIADHDFSMLDATSPVTGCGLTNEVVTVRALYNGCSVPAAAGDTVRFLYSVDGKPAVEDTLVLSTNVNARDTLSFTFDSPADVSSTGMHSMKVWIAYTGDTLAYNDTLANYTFENKIFQNVDVGVTKIVKPVSGCTLSATEPVIVQVQFFGCDYLPAGTKVPVDYTVNGGTAVVDTLLLAADLYPATPLDFTFAQTADLSASQTHTISAGTAFTPDIYTSNNRLNNYQVKKPLVVRDTTLTFEGNQAINYYLTHTTDYSHINRSLAAKKSGTYGLLMTGGNPADYLSLIQLPSGPDTWQINEFLSAKVDFCVDASVWDSVYMNFDLKQTCGQDLYTLFLGPGDYTAASSMRILVNDSVMIGNTYHPSSGNADPFVTRFIDLSAYAGTFFTLSFETRNIAKDSLGFKLDNAYIDNVTFNPVNTIGVREHVSLKEVNTFPNPSDGRFWIDCSPGHAGISSLEIYDYTGRMILSKTYDLFPGHNRIPVDIGVQPAGMYVVHMNVAGESYTGRVICK